MVSHDLARRAYGVNAAPTRSPRTLEYDAIAQVTRQLKTAADLGDKGFSELAKAIHENRRLWALFASSVADDDNALPAELRAQLFYLAEFTNVQSSKVLAGQAGVQPLLEVNTAILRGLRAERQAA
ncbi:flagellar biosynthesis regulator FlaF [Shimia sediminis]|uniref:flagellar biosynthesis regulator FlaF n=1 Tax=Shimia sediminis TaxID=2497945 RepID=UPI000F8DC988|nr:flagellar biosynthesis regulator FlaF [Shimia sediminis]